jgi:hypothetical protein
MRKYCKPWRSESAEFVGGQPFTQKEPDHMQKTSYTHCTPLSMVPRISQVPAQPRLLPKKEFG